MSPFWGPPRSKASAWYSIRSRDGCCRCACSWSEPRPVGVALIKASGHRRRWPCSLLRDPRFLDGTVVAAYHRGQSSGRSSHSMSSRTLAIAVLLLAVAAAGPPADAQQAPKIAKIGYLATSTPAAAAHVVEAFRQGLRELGYVEGKTFVLEVRYGEARFERLPELARELVGLKVDVIVAPVDPAIAAVKRETRTIPIVMT